MSSSDRPRLARTRASLPGLLREGSLSSLLVLSMTPLLGIVLASTDFVAQTGPRSRSAGEIGPDRRLPEIQLPDLILVLDGKPLREGTLVRAELVGAQQTTTIEGRVDEAGMLRLGKTRNLALLRGCQLRLTADFLPLESGEKKPAPQREGAAQKRPEPRNWFQCLRALELSVSPVRCLMKRMDPVFLGMGQLLDADKRPLVEMELEVRSYTGADKNWLRDTVMDLEGRGQKNWPKHTEPVVVLGGATTDAMGRFVIWSTLPKQAQQTFSVHFRKKGLLSWAGFRSLGDLERLRWRVSPTRRLAYQLVLPSDLPMEAVGLRLRTYYYSETVSLPPTKFTKLRQVGTKTHWRVNFDGLPEGQYTLQLYAKPDFVEIQKSKPTKITAERVEYPEGSPFLDWSAPLLRSPIQICDADGSTLQGSWVSVQTPYTRTLTRYSLPTDHRGRANPALLTNGETLVIWSHDHRFHRVKNPKQNQRILLEPVRATQFQIPANLARPRPDLRLEILLHIPPGSGALLPPKQIRGWWRATADTQGLARIKMGWQGTTQIYAILTNTATD